MPVREQQYAIRWPGGTAAPAWRFLLVIAVFFPVLAGPAVAQQHESRTHAPQESVVVGASLSGELPACGTDFSSTSARASFASFLSAQRAGRLPKSHVQPIQLEIGTIKTFFVLNPLQTGEIGWQPRTFRLADRDENLYYLWVATDESHLVQEHEVAELRLGIREQTSEGSIRPEHGILANDEMIFGPPPNYDGDHHTDIVLYDIRDPSIGGYVTLQDVDPSASYGTGNQADVLYVDSPRSVENMLPVIAHEYVHLLNITSGLDVDYTFNTEGFAEYGMVLNGFAFWRGIRYLYAQTDNGAGQNEYEYRRSLMSWRTDLPGGRDPFRYDYQRANLFFGYVADQLGSDVVGRMLRSNAKGPGGLDAVLRDNGTSLRRVVEDFHTANYANDPSLDRRFGYPLDGRPVIDARPTRVFDGDSTTLGWDGPAYETHILDERVRPGAVEYLEWERVADFSIDFDIYGANLFETDIVVRRREQMKGRLIGTRESGENVFRDIQTGGVPVTLPGRWSSVTLAAAHTDPRFTEGGRFRLAAAWKPPSGFSTARASATEQGDEFVVGTNYPDPFSRRTRIPFTLDRLERVRFTVFDALGRVLSREVAEALPAGDHFRFFDAGALPSGTYFYRMEAGERAVTRSMRIVR